MIVYKYIYLLCVYISLSLKANKQNIEAKYQKYKTHSSS